MNRLLLLSFVFLLLSCSKKAINECPPKVCTLDFRMISIAFKYNYKNLLNVSDFKAINRRTGKALTTDVQNPDIYRATYNVATDADRENLSSTGDTVDVSATNPETLQKKSAILVIAGGNCSCHIQKISGPEEIIFD